MDRKEFLDILREQLAGNMQEGKAAAHIRYYEDYIQSQVRGGRPESEVLEELGDPRLIAKTLIDTDDGSTQEDYGEYSSYGGYDNTAEQPWQPEKRWKKVLDLSTWQGKAVVIIGAVLAIILIVLVIGAVLPFFIILVIILSFLSWLKKRNH